MSNHLRKRRESWEWIIAYADKLDRAKFDWDWYPEVREYNPNNRVITVERLIQEAKEFISDGVRRLVVYDTGFDSDDFDYKFWDHFENVTGIKVDEDKRRCFFWDD
jgi:hypothetical protein